MCHLARNIICPIDGNTIILQEKSVVLLIASCSKPLIYSEWLVFFLGDYAD